jgi:hypothetical protein
LPVAERSATEGRAGDLSEVAEHARPSPTHADAGSCVVAAGGW